MANPALKTTTKKRRGKQSPKQTAAAAKRAAIPASRPVSLTPFPVNESSNLITNAGNTSVRKLPSAGRLLIDALRLLKHNGRLFAAITGIYAAASILFVQSLAGGLNVTGLQTTIASVGDRLTKGLVAFEWLTSQQRSPAAGVYAGILVLVASLAIVWALRQIVAGTVVRARDAYYKGMYPAIPVLIIVLVFVLQVLPLLAGLGVFNLVITFGFAESLLAKLLWGVPALGLGLVSLLLVTPTVISGYVATLPDMEPLAALKAGREVVRHRRWSVLRKLICLPVVLLFVAATVLLPVLLTVPLLSPYVAFALSCLILPVTHAYLYLLYRELII